jgi:hypothetical protein
VLSAAFADRAAALGHDLEALAAGETVVGYPHVPTLEATRALSAATPAQRRRRAAVYFNPVVEIRRRLGQGVHDRLEAAILAGLPLDPVDVQRGVRHFPLPVRTLSTARQHVGADETWDLSVRGQRWGLDDRDDVASVVNVDELVLEPGATVLVWGNLLVLTVARLVCVGGGDPGRIAILPTPFPVDAPTGPFDGPAGGRGADGRAGADGRPSPTAPTLLGPRALGLGAPDGREGTGGRPGAPGARGRTGGATKVAEITIGDLTGELTVLASGGRGGAGGNGGAGGDGGRGGCGAPGQRVLRGEIAPGRGGDGGDGGSGGHGGTGGHGGICSNVFIALPAMQERRLHVLAHPAAGGRGGSGGAGGTGGAGGAGTPSGRDGRRGTDGRDGRGGRARPAPPVFVNERAVPAMADPAAPPDPGPVRSLDTRAVTTAFNDKEIP